MILSLMRFMGYQWKHNPLEIRITEKNAGQFETLNGMGERLLPGVRKCTIITGKGELVGENAIEVYEELSSLFKEKKTGILTIPGIAPMYAQFSELSSEATTEPDVIFYSFTFTEVESVAKNISQKEIYIASEGESLFSISQAEGVSLETLVELNPQIRYIDYLSDGEEVRLC